MLQPRTAKLVTYISTRGEAAALSFEDVLLAGLARDGGLYVPETWPSFSAETIASFAGRPFAEVAAEVMAPFVGDRIDKTTLLGMAREAYGRFDHPAVTPLTQIDRNRWVLELFHGPTLAFKDVAMQLLARLMDHALAKRGRRATIVGATSGDTGGAAIEAFRGSRRVDVVILFPDGRVSDVQRRMMTTPTDANVHAVAVKGTFDDCQALVKGMFNDHAFRDAMSLSGVNSINWARIVAQVTYYFVAATALGAPHRAVTFAVPTGNFGDILAGWVAKRMGLPIETLVIASNENDILPRAHATGVYEMRGVTETSSPSMDIQISSNFERYLFEASGRDAGFIRGVMGALAQGGRFDLGTCAKRFGQEFRAAAASEADVADAIRRTKAASGYLLDPHTACGLVALERTTPQSEVPGVVLATAHPAKFPDAMERITGKRPGLPPRLDSLLSDPERFPVVQNDLVAVKRLVESAVRPAAEVK
ncbi:threonine synthase [Hyphomicrobium sp. CS1GBMeth3]|uniref:threonine synthase n=1 Tax=Hyphomicrobium sp. CS1GBMeth3 TaxID=1892845 RepID=UPI0009310133|nr:threonine synthase [Hyphomicrobium sp. CS1GBMeth3]